MKGKFDMKNLIFKKGFLLIGIILGILTIWSASPMTMNGEQAFGACEECYTTSSESCTIWDDDCHGDFTACTVDADLNAFACPTGPQTCFWEGTSTPCFSSLPTYCAGSL